MEKKIETTIIMNFTGPLGDVGTHWGNIGMCFAGLGSTGGAGWDGLG